MEIALQGIRVIDISQVAAVPICTRHLGDFGAEVLHIENPLHGDSWRGVQSGHGGTAGVASKINYSWENYNRNKKSITINLASDAGREILYRLVEEADVVVHNLRLWEMEKYKVDYITLKKINSKIIYGSLNAWGKKGPEVNSPGYDTTAWGLRSGMFYSLSSWGMIRPRHRSALGDNIAGLALALGVMTALYYREKTGSGQQIDVSLLQMGYYQNQFDIASALATGIDNLGKDEAIKNYSVAALERRKQLLTQVATLNDQILELERENAPNPLQNYYKTKDRRDIRIATLQPDRYWSKFCEAIESPELRNNPEYLTLEGRKKNRHIINKTIAGIFQTKTMAEWKQRLTDIPWAPVQNLIEAIEDPQAIENNMFVVTEHPVHGPIKVVANPVNMSLTPARYITNAPEFSQHTEETLLSIGYSWEQIAELKNKGVIA